MLPNFVLLLDIADLVGVDLYLHLDLPNLTARLLSRLFYQQEVRCLSCDDLGYFFLSVSRVDHLNAFFSELNPLGQFRRVIGSIIKIPYRLFYVF